MKLYGLKNCDTCRKALKELHEVEFIDVRESGVSEKTLEKAIATFQGALVNTRSTTWRLLADEDRALDTLVLLKKHPTVMKRPLIERDGELFLGWTPKVQSSLGL